MKYHLELTPLLDHLGSQAMEDALILAPPMQAAQAAVLNATTCPVKLEALLHLCGNGNQFIYPSKGTYHFFHP